MRARDPGLVPIAQAAPGTLAWAPRPAGPPLRGRTFVCLCAWEREWEGIDERVLQLSEKMGIPGGVFVHAGGFIGGNDTRVSGGGGGAARVVWIN